jgi:hypothetical protein
MMGRVLPVLDQSAARKARYQDLNTQTRGKTGDKESEAEEPTVDQKRVVRESDQQRIEGNTLSAMKCYAEL